MRTAIISFSLIMLLGVTYVLAKMQIIPAQHIAAASPALQGPLAAIGLYKPQNHVKIAAIASAKVSTKPKASRSKTPDEPASDASNVTLAAGPSQSTTGSIGDSSVPAVPVQTAEMKLDAIYATMSPDDIARIGAKQHDEDLIRLISSLDEKKAGKVLAALPDERAARIAHLMQTATATVSARPRMKRRLPLTSL